MERQDRSQLNQRNRSGIRSIPGPPPPIKACTTIQFSKTNPFGAKGNCTLLIRTVSRVCEDLEAKFPQPAPQSAAEKQSTNIDSRSKPPGWGENRCPP